MSMRFPRALLLSLALFAVPGVLFSSDAFAQDFCPAPYSHEKWRADMDKVDAAYVTIDLDTARRLIEGIWRDVGCLDMVAKRGHLARFARQKALLAFYDQDEDTAVRWGLLSRAAAPDFPWSSDMAEDHPFRSMVVAAEDPPIGGPEGQGLLVEKKSSYFMNGRPLLEPKAEAEIPNLVQQADKKGKIISTYWQDGAAFPVDVLGPVGEALTVPKWFVPSTSYADAGGPAGEVVAVWTPDE